MKCKCGKDLEATDFTSDEEPTILFHCGWCGRIFVKLIGSKNGDWIEHSNVHLIPKYKKQPKRKFNG
jgi:hypothetical protein